MYAHTHSHTLVCRDKQNRSRHVGEFKSPKHLFSTEILLKRGREFHGEGRLLEAGVESEQREQEVA
jgi:hypothetical protein